MMLHPAGAVQQVANPICKMQPHSSDVNQADVGGPAADHVAAKQP